MSSSSSKSNEAPPAARDDGPVWRDVALDSPIVRGEQTIAMVRLRKPRSGELRGLSLSGLAQLDVDEMRRLIPRISDPLLTQPDVDNMDPADLLACGSEVVDFLLPRARKPAFQDQ